MAELRDDARTYAQHLRQAVLDDAAGTKTRTSDVRPSGRFWLGTLAPEELQLRLDRGERGERLDPAEIGLRVNPSGDGPWEVDVEVSASIWLGSDDTWEKAGPSVFSGSFVTNGDGSFLADELSDWLEATSGLEHSALISTTLVPGDTGASMEITLLNTSPESIRNADSHLYETQLSVRIDSLEPFVLEALPDSFRYDRRIAAFGINGGVEVDGPWLRTADSVSADQHRPSFWNVSDATPDLSFATLASDPVPVLADLVRLHSAWGAQRWSDDALDEMADLQSWTSEMWESAEEGRSEFEVEQARLQSGLEALSSDSTLLRSFMLMNEALEHSSRGKYPGWRPFQIGFVLATCQAVADPTGQSDIADIVWFATGGGKTETYLGLVCMAAIHDRLTGKTAGVAAWSRFPLRLLSLQQTQRFADAMAGAELVRRKHTLGGSPFSMGFLIGASSTPNRIEEDPDEDWKPDPEDDDMPARYRVLIECPFCFADDIEMSFDHARWTLDHHCTNEACPWAEGPLPFRIVDDEIYRFLPTVVVGTLDKIASISIQASMVGLFGPPRAVCSEPGHGFTYAVRAKRPKGCLVPSCDRPIEPLPMNSDRFAPTFRLQDELHLLRDALGAVDAHYEALVDSLQDELTGVRSKILGSSATLSGYERQVDVLYRRQGRVFPAQGPSVSAGFWTSSSGDIARTHIALAPRGATLEFANDRIITVLQSEIRSLIESPVAVCSEIGLDRDNVEALVSLFGTNVVYGNTIRDLDAAARSLETQIPIEPAPNSATLTGQTPFDEVRTTLDRLQNPEEVFDDRVHVVTASSMMSHGVDVDRLNTMVVLGLPLTTAEYIQTTARVGRTWPSAVFVLHKMARERDASTFRSWEQFVTQGDRFVDAVPITRRSTRILERTLPGLMSARLLHHHERRSAGGLTTVKRLREYDATSGLHPAEEADALIRALGATDELDAPIREEIERWVEAFTEMINEPPDGAIFPSELYPRGQRPMLSLRDVEQQAPVRNVYKEGA